MPCVPTGGVLRSEFLAGGLTYKLASKGPMSVFKAAFGTSTQYNFGSYKADFVVPNSGRAESIFIPFSSFSNQWSPSTGEPTKKCSEHKEVCPTAKVSLAWAFSFLFFGWVLAFTLVFFSAHTPARCPPACQDAHLCRRLLFFMAPGTGTGG